MSLATRVFGPMGDKPTASGGHIMDQVKSSLQRLGTDHIDDNLAAINVTLSADELKTLDDASRLSSEYPGLMFEMQGVYRGKLIAQAKRD